MSRLVRVLAGILSEWLITSSIACSAIIAATCAALSSGSGTSLIHAATLEYPSFEL